MIFVREQRSITGPIYPKDAEDNFLSHEIYFWTKIIFKSAGNRDFSPKSISEEISGNLPDFIFSRFLLKERINSRNISAGRCRREIYISEINIRIRKPFKLNENHDFSQFSEFSSFSGFRLFIIFVIEKADQSENQ